MKNKHHLAVFEYMSQVYPIYSSKRISHIHIYFYPPLYMSIFKENFDPKIIFLLLLLILLNLFIISVRDEEFFLVPNSSAAGSSGRTV